MTPHTDHSASQTYWPNGEHGQGNGGLREREEERRGGGGDVYSMASWFSWSALMSSPASLPSLLLLLFLCLCLRWLSPSSLSCLLRLLLLMNGERGKKREKGSRGERNWRGDGTASDGESETRRRGQGEERKMGRDKIINVRIMKTGEMRSKLGENSWEAARVLFFF